MSGLKLIAEIKSSKDIVKFEILVINRTLLLTLTLLLFAFSFGTNDRVVILCHLILAGKDFR